MKPVFTLILLALTQLLYAQSAKAQDKDLTYTFQRRDSTSLFITVAFRGNKTGTTLLHLPNEWAGQQMLYKAVLDLVAVSANTTINATNKPYEYLARYAPGTKVTFRYVLSKDWPGPLKYPLYFRPVIQQDLFYFEGYSGLIYPNLADSLHIRCQLNYQGFSKDSFVGNSFFAKKPKGDFTVRLDNLLNGIFCAGNIRTKTITVEGHQIVMGITGNPLFKDEEAFSSISKIILAERKFWNDAGPAYYFTLFQPLSDQGNTGGTAHYNSFALFQSKDLELSENLLQMIAHEYFHNWLGLGLKMPEPNEPYKWFSEGFTDYYALKLLYKTDIISKKDFVAKINEYIRDYYLSPYFKIANQSLIGRYWENPQLKVLSYRRGLALAFVLDEQILEKKGKSLDDFLRSLYNESKPGLIFSDKLFDSLVSGYSDDTTLKAIDRANSGNNENLTKLLFAGKLYPADTLKISAVFNIGFNYEASKAAGKVIGLEPESNAAKAGITKNMQLTGYYNIWFNNTEKPAVIGVIKNGKKEQIQYIPVLKVNLQIPQISLVQK